MQVPQELAGLTTLTYLSLFNSLASREAAVALGMQLDFFEGVALVPKMRVTEQGCRFLLHFPALAFLDLSVTEKEKAALAGFLTELQRGRNGPFQVCLNHSRAFVLEKKPWDG